MDHEYFSDIVSKAKIIVIDGKNHIGVPSKDRHTFDHFYKFGTLAGWIKLINIDQAQEVVLSPGASFSVKDLTLEDKAELAVLVTKILHAKEYSHEYMENRIFDGLVD